MSDPTARNRLGSAASPYLRQHADNPVNWQPWDEQALQAAKERDDPIFLSIGYSACHWCHVMEEESFEDEAIAKILNENFVPIKVDREERPDLDSVYMSICQQVTGRGGWPLSAWLTPDGEPFYVGTYFPPTEKGNMPAFGDLLQRLATSWNDPDERPDVEERARQWTDAIESDVGSTPAGPGEKPDPAVLEDAASTAMRGADREFGGWGGQGGPKFPQPGRLHLLLEAAGETGRDEFTNVATEAMTAMTTGGLFDHVGGGFHRYCTDREWVVPHFEKMLYDNAEIPRALLAGYQVTGEECFADAARETIEFLQRELQHPEGGFYSTLDARSEAETGEQEEGAFYVWTPDQIRAIATDEVAAEIFCERYGISERGNFEGNTVLTVDRSIDSLAEEYDSDPGDITERLETTRQRAFEVREERPRPARDEKILAGWNGLTISMLAEASIVLDDSHAAVATDALAFVRDRLWDEDTATLHRRVKDGDVGGPGYLEDYAFLARGALDCYGATGEVEHLEFALDLARAIERDFWDATAETLYFTPRTGESLVARPQELTDQSTPSSAGVAAIVLGRLAHFAPDAGFEIVVEGVLETHGDSIRANPMQHATLVLAAAENALGNTELTLVPETYPAEWRETLGSTFVPRRLLAPRPAEDAPLQEWQSTIDVDETPPIWAGRDRTDDEPTVYACRDFTCSPPTHDLGEALSWALDDAAE